MEVRSLTRSEAESRAAQIRVRSYDVELDFAEDAETFAVTTIVRFSSATTRGSTFIELAPSRLRAARLNNTPLDLSAMFSAAECRLMLSDLDNDNELVVRADMPYVHDGEGVHRHVDPADGRTYLHANSATTAGPSWFACFDQPDLKASMRLSVRCPDGWIVVGNGPATETAAGQWQLAATPPISTYLAGFIAGPYHSLATIHDGVPLGLHAPLSRASALDHDANRLFELTASMLDEMHRLLQGRYPWGEYHQAFVPELNWRGLESPGCVMVRDSLLFGRSGTDMDRAGRATTLAHEMAHMWFGNLVTMRWWDDLWLHESFAEYLGRRVSCQVTGRNTWLDFGVERKPGGYTADQRPTAHPVAGNGVRDAANASTAVDGISYAKGGSLLRQLATYLGDECFLAGLRGYISSNAYATGSLDDIVAAWSAGGATGVDEWTQRWLLTGGLDKLNVSATDEQPRLVRLGASARSHVVSVAAFDTVGGELVRCRLEVGDHDALLSDALADSALILPNADDATWASVQLTHHEWLRMPGLVCQLDATARCVVWNAMRLAVTNAELDPVLAVEIAAAAVATEPDGAILDAGARWATEVLLGIYIRSGQQRERGERRLARALATAFMSAAPGSGRELAAARGWVNTADVDVLRRLSGNGPGLLRQDSALRWQIRARRCALGDFSVAAVEEAAAADPSTRGVVSAARCRALLPDTAAKGRAWSLITTDGQASNDELYATARGFWHPRHRHLTEPYVQRYFSEIPAALRRRARHPAAMLARYMFPSTAQERVALSGAAELLAVPTLDDTVRAAIVDGVDDLRRALVSQLRFGWAPE